MSERTYTSLQPCALTPLPLGSLRPAGWLQEELRLQANGLTGHLDEFWPDVKESGWIGGKAEGWERGPYWLDGVVPLAFLLDDAPLKAKARHWMDYVLTHQHEDGWLGPAQAAGHAANVAYRRHDPWPVAVFLKAAMQWHEATGDARVPAAMTRLFRRLDGVLDGQMLSDWNRMRWPDLVLSLHWLYDRAPEPWLLALAARLKRLGFDWLEQAREFPFTERVETGRWSYDSHVVNHAMAVKQPGVWWRQSGAESDRDGARLMLEVLDRYHGQATGVFTGDECLAGLNPSQGTELCAVVEYLFSLEVLAGILGDTAFADRLERIAFNALPGTLKPDQWAHQYVQQANQVQCVVSPERVYTTNGPDANLFGLEPNYGCCTANLHQGWPKFAAHLWMNTPDGGLAALAYAPCRIETHLAGQPVKVNVETDYPFNEAIRITVETPAAARFPLRLRIPAWAAGAEASVGTERPQPARAGGWHELLREWSGTTPVMLKLPMAWKAQRRFNHSLALERGPLVYSLKIGEDWSRYRGEMPHADWEVRPTTPWNYALDVEEKAPERFISLLARPVGPAPFSPQGAPLMARVKGRRLPGWQLVSNAAAPPPPSPVRSDQPLEDLVLIPYGCAKLRVTEFPTLR